jgi:hypothetical protein
MRVRCKGSVLRILKAAEKNWKIPSATDGKPAEAKIGVAVCLKGYEYLPEVEDGSSDFRRVSTLHGATEDEPSTAPSPSIARPSIP